MTKVRQRERARRDLVEHFVYLAENAGLATAERFLTNAEASFDELAANPLVGSSLTLARSHTCGYAKMVHQGF